MLRDELQPLVPMAAPDRRGDREPVLTRFATAGVTVVTLGALLKTVISSRSAALVRRGAEVNP